MLLAVSSPGLASRLLGRLAWLPAALLLGSRLAPVSLLHAKSSLRGGPSLLLKTSLLHLKFFPGQTTVLVDFLSLSLEALL